MDLAADETMRPEWIEGKGMTEHGDRARIIGASEKHDAAAGRGLQVQLPPRRHGWTRGGGRETGRAAEARRGDEPIGAGVERRQRLVMEAAPDFRLPAPIEVLDGVLEPVLAWRCEDGDHTKTQTEAHDTAHHVPVLMRSLKARVIVKLGIRGKPHGSPVREECRHRRRRGEDRARPRANQAAMQRDAVEDFDIHAAPDNQAFHEIEAIELSPPGRHIGQVPPGRRRRAADAPLGIEDPPAFENAMDRADSRDGGLAAVEQGTVNRDGPVIAQIARRPQVVTQGHHQDFKRLSCPTRDPRGMRSVLPIDAIETLRTSAVDPALHRPETDVMDSRDGPHRRPASNRAHDRTPLLRGPRFFAMLLLENVSILGCAQRVEAAGAVDAQNAPTAPWKTPRAGFPQLPHALFSDLDQLTLE